MPGISRNAAQTIQPTIRTWRLAATRINQSLEDIARLVNPSVRGWENYYGRCYRFALTPVLRHLERALVRWACRKFKRLRRHYNLAVHWGCNLSTAPDSRFFSPKPTNSVRDSRCD